MEKMPDIALAGAGYTAMFANTIMYFFSMVPSEEK